MVNKIVGFKVLIFPLAAVFVIMMSVLYIKPAYDEMQLLKKSQTEAQQQLDNLQSQNQKLAELKNKWDSMGNERSLTETALPAKSEMENYIAELYGRASRSGILLSSITSNEKSFTPESYVCGSSVNPAVSVSADGSAPITTQSCANTASVELAVSGNWDQLVNFFKYLEDTNRIANITSVAISASAQNKSGEQVSGDLLSATVNLSIFYKEKSEAGGSPSTIYGLASGKGFEENVITKLNEVIFAPYVAPVVSESGERNIFK